MQTWEIEFEDGTVERFDAEGATEAMNIADKWYARKFNTLLSEFGIASCREVACG